MVTKQPGWYPDPQGVRQVRLWDGDAWTEYTQPLAPTTAEEHDSTTALEDYTYLASVDLRTSSGPRIVSTWTPLPVAFLAPAKAPARRGRAGLIAWIVGGALLLTVIAAVAVRSVAPSDPGPPAADPAASPTVTLNPIGTGQDARGSLPADGELHLTVTVEQEGTYFVGATSPNDLALTITPTGATEPLFLPEDRGELMCLWFGGGWLDPGYFLDLDAGSYDIVVTERDGEASDVTVALDPVTTVDLTPGTTQTVTLEEDGYAVLRIVPEAAAPFELDARSTDGWLDGQLTYLSGARVTSLDDRGQHLAQSAGGSEFDPLLRLDLEPGAMFIVLDEVNGSPGPFTVTSTLG